MNDQQFRDFFADFFGTPRTAAPNPFPGFDFTEKLTCDVDTHNPLFGTGKCIRGTVYIARGADDLIKIGFTEGNGGPLAAMQRISRQYKMGFTFLFGYEAHCARGLEKLMHEKLKRSRVKNPYGVELYKLSEKQMAALASLTEYRGQPVKRVNALDLL